MKPTPSRNASEPARFVSGSIMHHVSVMTATSSIGLMAIFIVDFANLYYISQLGQRELAAAIGYAGTLIFFMTSICIGIMIGISALVSQALGAGNEEKARHLAGMGLLLMVAGCVLFSLILLPLTDTLLSLIGAKGQTKDFAYHFLIIVIPTMPLLGFGMACGGILRAKGDAKRAMYVTLIGGVTAALLDPLFIFGFDLGLQGAALAMAFSRLSLCIVGLYGVYWVHKIIAMPSFSFMKNSFYAFMVIIIPAILTNIATPIGNAFVTAFIAPFGDDAVAGWAIIGRIIPVAFGVIFALSGAVGPIFGQNLGARAFGRVRQTLKDSLIFTVLFTLCVWAVLMLCSHFIIRFFNAENGEADLVLFFCFFIAGSFIFNGMMFVANAAFNNLGYATYSTLFNWGKATLGTLPFIWLGSLYGAEGVLLGQAVGTVLFGLAAYGVCVRLFKNLEHKHRLDQPSLQHHEVPPFASGKASTS